MLLVSESKTIRTFDRERRNGASVRIFSQVGAKLSAKLAAAVPDVEVIEIPGQGAFDAPGGRVNR